MESATTASIAPSLLQICHRRALMSIESIDFRIQRKFDWLFLLLVHVDGEIAVLVCMVHFGIVTICRQVMCEVDARRYVSNIFLIVGMIVTLAFLGFEVDPLALADRASVVLLVMLTTAAYKSSIERTMPKKPYTTRLDQYFAVAFTVLVLSAIFMVIEVSHLRSLHPSIIR